LGCVPGSPPGHDNYFDSCLLYVRELPGKGVVVIASIIAGVDVHGLADSVLGNVDNYIGSIVPVRCSIASSPFMGCQIVSIPQVEVGTNWRVVGAGRLVGEILNRN